MRTLHPILFLLLSLLTLACASPTRGSGSGGGGHIVFGTPPISVSISPYMRTLLDDPNATIARATLGLSIGTHVQVHLANLDALGALPSAANKLPYFTGSGTANVTDVTTYARSLLGAATSGEAQGVLDVKIGQDVQAHDKELDALAGLTSAADKLPYFTGSQTAALTDLSAYARTLIDDPNASTARATLGLVIGLNVQAFDSDLEAIAGQPTNPYGRSGLNDANLADEMTRKLGNHLSFDWQTNLVTVLAGLGVRNGSVSGGYLDLYEENTDYRIRHAVGDLDNQSYTYTWTRPFVGHLRTDLAGSLTWDYNLPALSRGTGYTAKTADYPIDAATDSGRVFTNTGATGPVTFTLPGSYSYDQFSFVRTADYQLRIVPAAPATFLGQGDGVGLRLDDLGASVTIKHVADKKWGIVAAYDPNQSGTGEMFKWE